MPTAGQRKEDQRINALAFRLCKRWQQSQKRKLSLDELAAFMAGVVAAENERLQPEERKMSDQPKPEEYKEQPKEVEKDKPLDQKVKETDHPPAGPATVVIPPG